jgi:hypothetical protein
MDFLCTYNVSFDFVNSRVRFPTSSPLPVATAAPSNQAFASSGAAPVAATPSNQALAATGAATAATTRPDPLAAIGSATAAPTRPDPFAATGAATVAATPAAAAILPPAQPPPASVTALLNRYPTITSSTATSWPTPTHTTSHHIQTMGPNDRLARDRRPVYKPTLAVNKLSV